MIRENYEQDFKFNVSQILTSNSFSTIEKDVLKAILNESNSYSLDEVKHVLEQFKKGDVR